MFNASKTKITIIEWIIFFGWLVIGWTLLYGLYYNAFDYDTFGDNLKRAAKFFGLLSGGFIGWVQGVLLDCLIYHFNNQEEIISKLDKLNAKNQKKPDIDIDDDDYQ